MGEILAGPAPTEGDEEQRLVANAKKVALLVMGLAYQRFLMELEKQQEVLMGISDIIMETFAMESALLRSRKVGQFAAIYTSVLLRDAMARIEVAARPVVAACSDGDALRTNMAVLRRYTKYEPVDAIGLRRKIAERLLETGRYA
jgi:hypothetical protein